MAIGQVLEEVKEETEEVKEKTIKESTIYRTPLFTKIYTTNLKVFQTDADIRIELFNEKRETEDEVIYYSDGLAILTPEAAKKLSIELKEVIEKYEIENREIRIREFRKNNEFDD
ncbi:MAG: hypothetical protein QG646_279 [Euryarchaeota archaeon]|nr:hypothetical protein [Euryarchaeota archaeon]